jgi:hypothetical protein
MSLDERMRRFEDRFEAVMTNRRTIYAVWYSLIAFMMISAALCLWRVQACTASIVSDDAAKIHQLMNH